MDSPEVSEAAMKAERQLAEMRNDINWGVIRTRRVAVVRAVHPCMPGDSGRDLHG